jgi:hypothetical protein
VFNCAAHYSTEILQRIKIQPNNNEPRISGRSSLLPSFARLLSILTTTTFITATCKPTAPPLLLRITRQSLARGLRGTVCTMDDDDVVAEKKQLRVRFSDVGVAAAGRKRW